MNRKTLLLAILDGWGCADPSPTNAITVADTPNMDRWMAEYPFTTLVAHNGMVGLPEGQMGNSEVGHLNIGAGRIVYQDFTRINKTIASGTFSFNTTLSGIMENVKEAGSALHFFGLLSDGGVHSHIDHLKALLAMAAKKQLDRVFVHCFMDGRDTAPTSGAGFVRAGSFCFRLLPRDRGSWPLRRQRFLRPDSAGRTTVGEVLRNSCPRSRVHFTLLARITPTTWVMLPKS